MIWEHYNGTTRILILAEIIVLMIQFHDEKKKLANANINKRIKSLPRKNFPEDWHGGETMLLLINLPILGFSKNLYR